MGRLPAHLTVSPHFVTLQVVHSWLSWFPAEFKNSGALMMLHRSVRFSVVMIVLALLAGWGCSGGPPPRVEAPSIDEVAAGEAAVQQYGKNGRIAGEDLDKSPALKASLKQIDLNNDGVITAEEISARIKVWKDSKVGRSMLNCQVMRKRGKETKPLEGATVTLEPEKFLGPEMKPATGRTDKNGVARMTTPPLGPNDPEGVPPGFYLVKITKEDEQIPARYNTDTKFGVEVSADSGYYHRYEFDLEYN